MVPQNLHDAIATSSIHEARAPDQYRFVSVDVSTSFLGFFLRRLVWLWVHLIRHNNCVKTNGDLACAVCVCCKVVLNSVPNLNIASIAAIQFAEQIPNPTLATTVGPFHAPSFLDALISPVIGETL